MTMRTILACAAICAAPGCGGDDDNDDPIGLPAAGPDDGRRPELGDDLRVMLEANISMSAGLAQAGGTGIEAKFEITDSGSLDLSTYPVDDISLDSERSEFVEVAGDARAATWAPGEHVFDDEEHLKRSSRDLTLVQLSAAGLADVVAADGGVVFWAIPTVHDGRPGYGVYSLQTVGDGDDGDGDDGDEMLAVYRFVDGGGANQRQMLDLGTGPGPGATDARSPELGEDLTVMRTATITMSTALALVAAEHGEPIEAKFELDGTGALSLSVYPADDIAASAEHNTFTELAGDPTGSTWSPTSSTFTVPDFEHLTRSARDLTLVQTAGLTLREAVDQVEAAFPGGVVYWAIPTRRGTQAGYGIYVLDADDQPHYLFVS
jgi:hypothetical protein